MSDYENLKPGTPEAVAKGCQCERGQLGPRYVCNGRCPVHGVAEFAAYLRDPEEARPTEADHSDRCYACKDDPNKYPDGECQHGFIY